MNAIYSINKPLDQSLQLVLLKLHREIKMHLLLYGILITIINNFIGLIDAISSKTIKLWINYIKYLITS